MTGVTGRRFVRRVILASSMVALSSPGFGGVAPSIQTGVPQMVIPLYPEVGAPSFTTPMGSGNGGTAPTGSGDGGGFGPPEGGDDSGNGSAALDTMNSRQWGAQAATNASSIGLNPSALAATCAVESGCDSTAHNGNFVGAFQMGNSAFKDGLAAALAANPALASQIMSGPGGINDPATNAIAAAGYMLKGANELQKAGVAEPTFSQVRGYFQFGPADGRNIARASPDQTLGSVLQYTSTDTLAANRLTSDMTVAQYQATFAAKAGGAANQVVKL